MLPLSNFEIIFDKSNSYVRIAVLVHCFALLVLLNSSLSNWLACGLVFVLCVCLLQIAHRPNHLYRYAKLIGYPTVWVLQFDTGKTIVYEKAHICFDGGLFIVLQLTADTHKKQLLIFKDQITQTQHRMLQVITKIQRS